MRDLRHPRWMFLKAGLLLGIGGLSFALLLVEERLWPRVALQLAMIWGFCRAYYFAFYVIEHYIDGAYRFAGLLDFAKYLARGRRAKEDQAIASSQPKPGEPT